MIGIVGAAAISGAGFSWRGLLALARAGRSFAARTTVLAESHPDAIAIEVPPIPIERDAGDAKQRRLMSRAARLAAIAARDALGDAGWGERRDEIGYFLGVGASGGALREISQMVRASRDGDAVSMARLGTDGLPLSNPLHTFQVLNNFTMCHGAILEGLGGPGGAFFSRGEGTVAALHEAAHAIVDGECDRALAGGADTTLHAMTWEELRREGRARLTPAEGAALVAIARDPERPIAWLERCALTPGAPARDVDVHVIHASTDEGARAVADARGDGPTVDAGALFGEALAAAPALAWTLALDLVASGAARRARVLSSGLDGRVGDVIFAAGGAS